VSTVVMVITGSLLASCGSGHGGGTSARPPTTTTLASENVHSYLLGGTDDVYWMQIKGTSDVEGVFEELLGPALTPDMEIHDYVYRLSGSITGQTLTFHLTALTPNTPPVPGALTGTVSAQSVVLGQPLAGSSDPVLTPATQAEFNTLARAHEETWKVSN
jgi:hypothetical protein